jgi:hypothetical protein
MPPEDPQLLCKTDYRLLCHAEHVRKPFLFQDPLCYVSVRNSFHGLGRRGTHFGYGLGTMLGPNEDLGRSGGGRGGP